MNKLKFEKSKVKNKKGELTKNNKESANFYSMRYLWSCDKIGFMN